MVRSLASLALLAVASCHADPRAGLHLPEYVNARYQSPKPRPQVVLDPQVTPPESAQEAPQEAPKTPPEEPPESPQESPETPQEAPKSDAPVHPDGEAADEHRPVDETDEQRARDEVAFENDYLRMKERLVPDQLGKWIAIVDGRLFPTDAKGKLVPAATLEECLAAADAANAKTLHRFVFRIGEEGDIVYADAAKTARSVVGTALKSTLGVVAGFDAASGELTWTRGEKSRRFKFERDCFQLLLSDPIERQAMVTPVADSSGFGGFVALEAGNAALLDAARFEIPGRVLLKTADGIRELRRTRVRVRVAELDIDVTVPAAAWLK